MISLTRFGWRSPIAARPFLFLVLALVLFRTTPSAADQSTLTLSEVSQRALQKNPDLQVFQWRLRSIDGARQIARLKPAYELGLEAENVLGSSSFSGTDNSELTVSLSSVIELGNKRQARSAVESSRYTLAMNEREASALNILGMTTQRFISVLTLQEKLKVAKDAADLAEATFNLVRQRVERGAAPKAEQLRAQSAFTLSRLQQGAVASELESRKLSLAVLWGSETVEFDSLEGDLFHLSQATNFLELYERASSGPALQVFASEARLRDAEIELARSQSSTNLRWSVGARRFQASSDTAITAGISIPLFSGQRNRGELQAVMAQRDLVDSQRNSTLLALRARLFEAFQTYNQSSSEVQQMRSDVLPTLELALKETRKAYEHGRYSYIDWVAAQRELLDARVMVIDAASTALLNQALIEQLTAEPLGLNVDSQSTTSHHR